ncbi:hypothetical protein PWG15_00585 [Ensifer adhaerens]|uniref:hypothetical protein n=1 Tax=Ensifer adhaerens TaxID=106592 RepID=UPI0023A95EAA|nr:hypothetical protein [Ensifer adhaerens]WDZ77042.1 hypothetical protein PWG15_00585 [Ensifer adhaerens]
MPLRFLKNPFLFLLLNALAACAALNAGSIDKLSKLDPSKTDPADLRVALMVPKELVLKRGDATLGLSWREGDAPAESQNYALDIEAGGVSASALGSHVSSGETLYVLALAETDAARLRMLQAKVALAKGGKPNSRGSLSVNFSGGCWRGDFPAGRKVTVNAWMQMAPDTDYFPVLSDLDLMQVLKPAGAMALPACPL